MGGHDPRPSTRPMTVSSSLDSLTPLCDRFAITPEEIRARRRFHNFTPDDEANLAEIRSLLARKAGDIIEEFYAHLLEFGELHRFIPDEKTLLRLKETQKQYLIGVGLGADQLDYFEGRLRVGMAHERIGLKLKWYIGAYATLFEITAREIAAEHAGEAGKISSLLASLEKIFTLDLTLALETYYETTVERVESMLKELESTEHKLRLASRLDSLTKINNRQFLMETLEMEILRSRRFNRPFTLLFADIDHFKEINDQHGHVFGDFVLQAVVELMRGILRPTDIIGRFGGEEFVIGLVETNEKTAEQIAERIRLKVAHAPFEQKNKKAPVTLSIGVVALGSNVSDLDHLLERADHAMYEAKAAGRNRVFIGGV